MIDQVRHGFGHTPRVAGGAHAATFAGVFDREIVLALVAVGSEKAVSEDAALEIGVGRNLLEGVVLLCQALDALRLERNQRSLADGHLGYRNRGKRGGGEADEQGMQFNFYLLVMNLCACKLTTPGASPYRRSLRYACTIWNLNF